MNFERLQLLAASHDQWNGDRCWPTTAHGRETVAATNGWGIVAVFGAWPGPTTDLGTPTTEHPRGFASIDTNKVVAACMKTRDVIVRHTAGDLLARLPVEDTTNAGRLITPVPHNRKECACCEGEGYIECADPDCFREHTCDGCGGAGESRCSALCPGCKAETVESTPLVRFGGRSFRSGLIAMTLWAADLPDETPVDVAACNETGAMELVWDGGFALVMGRRSDGDGDARPWLETAP